MERQTCKQSDREIDREKIDRNQVDRYIDGYKNREIDRNYINKWID